MLVLYTCDGEITTTVQLDELIANFNENGGWYARHNEEDMRRELASRGWYDGLHECGHYLVLNLEMLDLKPVARSPAGLRRVKWSFDWPETAYVGWTDDTHWNGFLNVAIDPLTRDDLVAELEDHAVNEDDRTIASDIAALPVKDGLVWLRDGWAISEVTMD